MLAVGWSGRIVHRVMVYHHFVYPTEVVIAHVKLIEWVSKNLEDKFICFKSQFLPFHV